MNPDRDYLIRSLAHQVLGMTDPNPSNPRGPSPGAADVGEVKLSLEVQGIVRNQCRQFYIDSAAWTEKIVCEIRRQAENLDIDAYVAEAVARELASTKRDIDQIVKTVATKLVENEIRDRLKTMPEHLAQALASRVYHEAYEETARKREKDTPKSQSQAKNKEIK